jgi:hypothetical protein
MAKNVGAESTFHLDLQLDKVLWFVWFFSLSFNMERKIHEKEKQDASMTEHGGAHCNPSTREAEERGSLHSPGYTVRPRLHSEFRASLGWLYTETLSQKYKKKK